MVEANRKNSQYRKKQSYKKEVSWQWKKKAEKGKATVLPIEVHKEEKRNNFPGGERSRGRDIRLIKKEFESKEEQILTKTERKG